MFNEKSCSLIAMVHVAALPGASGYEGDIGSIIDTAVSEARLYEECGVDAVMLENMHDTPYLKGFVEPETTAAMAVVCRSVREAVKLPVGVQVLAAANIEALGVAVAAGLDFIRVEGFVFAHVADEGLIESCAARLIRRRAAIKADKIKIFADIKKKHSAHAITSDVDLVDTAINAEFFKADGVIVTGKATGEAADLEAVRAAKRSLSIPVLVGSGVTEKNIEQFASTADALIVGSYLKRDGHWANPVDRERVRRLIAHL